MANPKITTAATSGKLRILGFQVGFGRKSPHSPSGDIIKEQPNYSNGVDLISLFKRLDDDSRYSDCNKIMPTTEGDVR